MRRNKIRESNADRIYDFFKWIIMGGFALICLLPMLNLLGVSFASARELANNPYLLWPQKITFSSYEMILSTGTIPHSLINSLIITLAGVMVGISLTSVLAYGLSKREVPGNDIFNFVLLIFIVFQVGIIPMYITMKTYGLVGKYAAVVLGAAINPFWCVIMRNFFEELPKELFECAKIEGASEIRIFWQIAIPLSMASFAAISLFYAIYFWNDYFTPLMYISDMKKWPVTVWMYQMVSSFQSDQLVSSAVNKGDIEEDNIKATVIFISIIPIICVYPFLQKHFAQGMTLGAVKG